MRSGAPVRNPVFYATNDRMLMGEHRKDRQQILYNPNTGDFVYLTTVFAAYAMPSGPEPGPYQTGSAQTQIEADGAEALTVQFFDEMPHVEITLDVKKDVPR
jgi:hypothetical protein